MLCMLNIWTPKLPNVLRYSVPFLLRVPHFFPIFLLPLGMPIDSEMMDGFWHSRCLSDCINLLNMIGTFLSGTTNYVVAKIRTKDLAQSLESEIIDGFWHLRCPNGHINLPDMIKSVASGANASLVAKNGTKKLFHYCR